MSPARLASTSVVAACRVSIAATGWHWLVAGDGLRSGVAAVALALAFAPARLLRDPPLRDATNLVIAILLCAHIVLGMQVGLYETSTVYDKWMHVLGSGAERACCWARRCAIANSAASSCRECAGAVKVIAAIEDPTAINKILVTHLDAKAAAAEPRRSHETRVSPQARLFD